MAVLAEGLPEAPTASGYAGLRAFLDLLGRDGDLARVSRSVDLDQELGAVCVHNLRRSGPALLFERPGNHDMPVLVNLLSTRRRYARAMGCGLRDIHQRWNAAASDPLQPVLLDGNAPCQEVIQTGDDVDLLTLPAPRWNALDGGPYLTLSCHVSRDPRTGERNVGVYRNQVHDKRTLGLLAGPFAHLMLQRRHEPDAPFPVALVIGPDPRVVMAASTPLPFGVDELAMAGALRGKPIELVRCKTVPLEVPADAELVIEGEVRPAEMQDEGPFGEYTGHYGGRRAPRPTIHVTAMTRRHDAILSLAYQGAPPHETEVLVAVGKEAELMRTVSLPGVRAVYMTSAGCGSLHLVISVEKMYEGYGKMVGMAFLSAPASRSIKRVVVVDEDVDAFDPLAVEWAIATRVQAHRDVEIFTEMPSTSIDPSLPAAEQTRNARASKMLIDATRYDAKSYPAVCLPSAEAMAKVERDWDRYGISTKTAAIPAGSGTATAPSPSLSRYLPHRPLRTERSSGMRGRRPRDASIWP